MTKWKDRMFLRCTYSEWESSFTQGFLYLVHTDLNGKLVILSNQNVWYYEDEFEDFDDIKFQEEK